MMDKLARLRDRTTEAKTFRGLVREISQLLFYEATQDLKLAPVTIQTPLAPCAAHQIIGTIGLIPILRAGLGMAEALLDMIPNARVWHLGLYRDHDTCQPVIYYNKLPSPAHIDLAMVVDPMLATGGSAVQALNVVKEHGATDMRLVCIVCAPEGVAEVERNHPGTIIHTASLDRALNARKYILPGLGDFGDRLYGT